VDGRASVGGIAREIQRTPGRRNTTGKNNIIFKITNTGKAGERLRQKPREPRKRI
jgi:hypothetical protein